MCSEFDRQFAFGSAVVDVSRPTPRQGAGHLSSHGIVLPVQGISPHSSGEISLISGFASKAIPGNEKDELRGETASDAGLPLKGKRRLSAALNPFRRRDSIELALSPSAVRQPPQIGL